MNHTGKYDNVDNDNLSFMDKVKALAAEGPLFSDSKLDKHSSSENDLTEGMNRSPAAAFGAIDRMGGF